MWLRSWFALDRFPFRNCLKFIKKKINKLHFRHVRWCCKSSWRPYVLKMLSRWVDYYGDGIPLNALLAHSPPLSSSSSWTCSIITCQMSAPNRTEQNKTNRTPWTTGGISIARDEHLFAREILIQYLRHSNVQVVLLCAVETCTSRS